MQKNAAQDEDEGTGSPAGRYEPLERTEQAASPLCGGYDPLGGNRCPELSRAVEGIKYIAEVTKREEDSNKVGCFPFSALRTPTHRFSCPRSFRRLQDIGDD